MTARSYLSDLVLDKVEISSARLNIESKERSNLFPWNGQFSPQFVEAILARYASEDASILDPFCGSGTVLAEANRLGFSATGIELNPAAYILARTYSLANLSRDDRLLLLSVLERKLQSIFPKGWPHLTVVISDPPETYQRALIELHSAIPPQERNLLETLIILADFFKGVSALKLAKTWNKLRTTVERLPYNGRMIEVHNADGRYAPGKQSYDVVLTSPPYINVYNYHQQYRASAEALGWNLLEVAKTEIGSNRKHRSNRFLTVTQYCLDLAICFRSLWNATSENARLIFVMGRESRVRGVPFFNGEIAAALAIEALGYRLVLRQERVFTNRFGQRIFEDILHFQKPSRSGQKADCLNEARLIADLTLRAALDSVEAGGVKADICDAIDRIPDVTESPHYMGLASGAS